MTPALFFHSGHVMHRLIHFNKSVVVQRRYVATTCENYWNNERYSVQI